MNGFIPIGYLPKATVVPKDWTDCDRVSEICSVSGCIARGPENWIEYWLHNDFGYFNSEANALHVCGAARQSFQVLGLRMLMTRFANGESLDFKVPDFGVQEFPDHYVRLGYDALNAMPELKVVPFLECSPLSCNGFAKEIPVNQYCLMDSCESAVDLASQWSIGGAEPGSYFVVEVLRSGRPNQSPQLEPAVTHRKHAGEESDNGLR